MILDSKIVRILEAGGIEWRKSGAQLVTHCVFHDERTPSMYIHPGKDVFQCHGCRAAGGYTDLAEKLGLKLDDVLGPLDTVTPRPPRQAPPERPRLPALEVSRFWDACVGVTGASGQAAAFLAKRGYDAQELERHDLARLAPLAPDLFPWWCSRWVADHRLVVPAWTPGGLLASLHARSVSGALPKTLWPWSGPDQEYNVASGLLFADAGALALMSGTDKRPRRVLLCEGVTDYLRAALAVAASGGDGVVIGGTSGSWSGLARVSWPEGCEFFDATDADEGGSKQREAILSALGKDRRIRRVEIPQPSEGKRHDLSDFLDAGGRLGTLVVSAQDKALRDLGFHSAGERVRGERERRRELVRRRLLFGISFLDDATRGILPNDIILVTAYAGAGKTQFGTMVAQENARTGKRVVYFALEAEPDEIERRAKYRAIIQLAKESGRPIDWDAVSYLAWHFGELDEMLGPNEKLGYKDLDAAADLQVQRELASMLTFYRHRNFGISDLRQRVIALKDDVDLVVVDHLHYLDLESERDANAEWGRIVHEVRDMSLATGIPVILVVHLRKQGSTDRSLIPAYTEIHGSSEIYKVATKIIAIARAERTEADAPNTFPTYIGISKMRMEGAFTGYVGLCAFDITSASYDPEYDLMTLSMGRDRARPVARERIPRWAKRARLPAFSAPPPPAEDDDDEYRSNR